MHFQEFADIDWDYKNSWVQAENTLSDRRVVADRWSQRSLHDLVRHETLQPSVNLVCCFRHSLQQMLLLLQCHFLQLHLMLLLLLLWLSVTTDHLVAHL